MRTPQLTADRTLYRSRRTYRGVAGGLPAATQSVVMADLAGWCCSDDMHCIYCPTACYVTASGPHCLGGTHVVEEAMFRMAHDWPFHCMSGGPPHHEVYCQHGCAADQTHAFCILTHATSSAATTEPVYLKA